jgi:hypothetical protein
MKKEKKRPQENKADIMASEGRQNREQAPNPACFDFKQSYCTFERARSEGLEGRVWSKLEDIVS